MHKLRQKVKTDKEKDKYLKDKVTYTSENELSIVESFNTKYFT